MSPTKRDRKANAAAAPKPPSVNLVIADASLFEYLASAESSESSDDEPPGGTFPVLIFDANLPKQYDVAPGASWGTQPPQSRTPANLPSFPEFDSVDWRNAGVQKRSGEKAWRVRPKGKGILRSTVSPEPPSPPAISIKKELSDKDGEFE
jgi:autophagy-related protein 2